MAAIRFVPILPLLAMPLLGAINKGISYSHTLDLANAVRESAEFGAVGRCLQTSWAPTRRLRRISPQKDDPMNTTTVCVQSHEQG